MPVACAPCSRAAAASAPEPQATSSSLSPGLRPIGLQERRDRIGGDRREEMIVALGERVVARALKGSESRAIGFRQFGCHPAWPRLRV
ncbi:MAG TPA: hypothetical protein VFN84_00410 [Pseudolabrys sp.]|nr:hypothetical protein [Pseudolabrys sp.]